MTENKFDIKETILAVDINEATQAVKENRFHDAIKLLEISLIEHPDHMIAYILQVFVLDILKSLMMQ